MTRCYADDVAEEEYIPNEEKQEEELDWCRPGDKVKSTPKRKHAKERRRHRRRR
jgi:hypothetical protein